MDFVQISVKMILRWTQFCLLSWQELPLYSSDGRVVRASALGAVVACRLGFDSESGQTNDFKFSIHSFPAWRSALKGQCGEQAGKLICCAVGNNTRRDSPILVW